MLETLLGFRNPDNTENINARLNGLIPKGIIKGGIVVAEPSTLQVRVKGQAGEPWVLLAISEDGMVVRERAEEHVLPITPGITNVIVLRAKYLGSQPPIVQFDVIPLGQYLNDPDKNFLIRLASVTPPSNAIAVNPEDIDPTYRDSIEGLTRQVVRGIVETVDELPAVSGFPATAEMNFLANDFVSNTSVSFTANLLTETFPIVPAITFDLASPSTPGLSRSNPGDAVILSAIEAPLTGVVTVTTQTPHGLFVGNQIRIVGNSAAQANGLWIVASLIDPTTITFIKSGSATPFSGTGGRVVNTASIAVVTAVMAPGVVHNILAGQPIVVQNATDPTFNTTSTVISVIDSQTIVYQQTGYPSADSGNGTVTKVGFSLPVNGVQIGASETVTARNFETVFKASTLAPLIKAVAIGSSLQFEATLPGTAGNSFTLSKTEPGVLPGDERIVLSGPSFMGGIDPISGFETIDLRAGDIYAVLYGESGTFELWGFDGIIFRNLTSAATGSLLDFHRRNLLTNEKHLTENEKAALKGTVGTPSATNRFVTAEDTSVLSSSIADALQGADGEPPNNSNRFLTEARVRGERASAEIPGGATPSQDWVQLTAGERWVVGNEVDSAIQFFNVVFTDSLKDPGGPTEYTNKDFQAVIVDTLYVDPTFVPANELDPSDPLAGADTAGVYPRLDAAVLSNPIDLYVKLNVLPDNGGCTVLYSRAAKEKVRKVTADNLMGPQRIIPSSIKELENKTEELRFNTGISVSGPVVSFPGNLFVSSNLQDFSYKRLAGVKPTSLELPFSIDFSVGTGTGGIVNTFTPVAFPAGSTWTKYLLSLTQDGTVNVHHISNLLEQSGDADFALSLSGVAVPSFALTTGEWIFASVGVQSNVGNTGIEDLDPESLEFYTFTGPSSVGAEIVVGDGSVSAGHFTGSDAHIRALNAVNPGDTIKLLPGVYVGQWYISTEELTIKFAKGAKLQHMVPEVSVTIPSVDVNDILDEFYYVDHGLRNGHVIQFTTTGTLPGGISPATDYYVVNATGNTFQVSLTVGGSAEDITSAGSGNHTAETILLCLTVDAADLKIEDPEFTNCDLAVNITGNASNLVLVDPHFSAVISKFRSASTLTFPIIKNRGATWICTDGSNPEVVGDFNSANALNAVEAVASPGDLILIHPGTYTRILNWSKSNVTMRGFSGSVFIDGGGVNPAITISGSDNTFEDMVLTNASIGCSISGTGNIISSSVRFDSSVVIPAIFPATIGIKHRNFLPLISSGQQSVSGVAGKTLNVVTCGDGVSSWGDYVGTDAISQAVQNELPGTLIKVAKGTYTSVTGLAFSNLTIEGSGSDCIIEAIYPIDELCFEILGDGNRVSGFRLQAVGNNTSSYHMLGFRISGNDNVIKDITFPETGLNDIFYHRRYSVVSGRRNKFFPHTGGGTGYVSWTVGDGRRSFGDFNGLNGIVDALGSLPIYPYGTGGVLSASSGNQITFSDPTAPYEFLNTSSFYYIDALHKYLTISAGSPSNIGNWKVVSIVSNTSLLLERFDGGAFVNEVGGVIWSLVMGAKIVVLPGTYSPFSILSTQHDIDVEAWGAGGDVIVEGGSPLVTVGGNRNRVSGFRFENGAVGVQVDGSDNLFEKNIFATTTRYQIGAAALGNRILDSFEHQDKTYFTVSSVPSRADFVGTDESAIQAAVMAAAADPHIKKIVIGAGTYTFVGTVSIPGGITIEGLGYDTHLVGDGLFPAFTLFGDNHTISGIRFDTFSNSLLGPSTGVFAYGNWLIAAPINGNVTGSVADNL